MSVDTGHTMGVTRDDITNDLRDTPADEPTTTWSWNEPENRPAAWAAFGED